MTIEFSKYQVKSHTGELIDLGRYRGQVVLVVNVASQCGFTPQYTGLQALYDRYKDKGFVILGFPCNQFGFQEPEDGAAIQDFCDRNYKVKFPILSKIKVNGPDADPFYRDLKDQAPGLFGSKLIKWNFTKFLINREGQVVARFAPRIEPEEIGTEIEKLL